MATQVKDIRNAIQSSDLQPIEHVILAESFLDGSYDQEAAANEIHRRILASPGEPIEQVLRQLKTEWRSVLFTALEQTAVSAELTALLQRRDKGRCCISPRHCEQLVDPVADYLLSPSLAPLLETGNQSPEAQLLQAFVAPKNVPGLSAVLSANGANTTNAWLLSPGLGAGIRRYKLTLQALNGSQNYGLEPINMEIVKQIQLGAFSYDSNLQYCDRKPLSQDRMSLARLSTDSPSETPLPSPYLIRLQRAFAEALDHFAIEEECSKPWPPRQTNKFWNRSWLLLLRRLWHAVPKPARVWIYKKMLPESEQGRVVHIYQSQTAGLFAKRDAGNEAAALAFLEAEAPSVPAPILIDTYKDDAGGDIAIMTQVPGVQVLSVLYRMTYQERRQLANDLGAVIAQMRLIPNRSGHLFSGVSKTPNQGAKIRDAVVGCHACGPFDSEDEWNESMTGGNVESWRSKHPEAFSRKHKSFFTHADLHLKNILVDGGKLSGILDWEISGFYPEYWEFAKGMRSGLNFESSQPIHRQVFQNQYEAEYNLVADLITAFPWGPPQPSPSRNQIDRDILASPLCRASPDGRLVATLSAQTISVRSVETLQTEHAIQLPSDIGPVSSLLWSPSSTRLLVGAGESVHVFTASIDSSFHATISSPLLPGEKANIARFGARDSEVLICSPSGLKLSIFNLSTSTALEVANPKFHQPSSVGRSYSVRPETEHLAILTRSNGKDFVSIHHPVSRQVQKSWAVETVDAQAVSWTPDGKWLMLWESAAHGHHLVLYTADGQHFRTITGINLSENPDSLLELGIKTCQPSHNSELCAVGDHSRDVVILQTDSWRRKLKFSHPVTIVPQDTLQVWQEQLNTSKDGQTIHTFQRATQMISPPGMPSDGKPIETKPGCSTLAFDASSNLLATKLDDAPCTVWIWDIVAAELRAVLVFHSVVSFTWHKNTRELLLITSQDESRQGLSYLWDPLLQGPTPVVPEEFISVKNSVGAPVKAHISWINTDMEIPLALLSTAQQYRILSLGEGDQVPETWHGASKWDDEPPRRKGADPDISEISIDDGTAGASKNDRQHAHPISKEKKPLEPAAAAASGDSNTEAAESLLRSEKETLPGIVIANGSGRPWPIPEEQEEKRVAANAVVIANGSGRPWPLPNEPEKKNITLNEVVIANGSGRPFDARTGLLMPRQNTVSEEKLRN
ncbi:hypothetical protein PWT90_06626 [Aphanocladium album]|nr:hypothetical protein PWT90_06626 [Aphanocladium album]